MLSSESLFSRYFLPLYPPAARADLAKARAEDANPAQNPTVVAQLADIAQIFAELAPRALGQPDLRLDFTDASVHRLGVLLTAEVRDRLLAPPNAEASEDGAPPLLVQVVIHGAVYLGECVVRTRGARWLVRRPAWESLVRLESPAGTADLPLFHWWLKALSDDEIGKGRLVDRYRTHVEVPTFDPESLPVIAPVDRKIPRLAKVRYDLLYKHLRAHLPELRTVGDDFPSPERFEQYGFSSLEFRLLGGGRMLLVSGATKEGQHLFWLDSSGFQKSCFFPADPFPAPILQEEGGKLRVVASVDGQQRIHEMLWWGA